MAESVGGTMKLAGTAVPITGEATTGTSLGPYQITDAARRCLDPDTAITVKDGGVAVPGANIASIDRFYGRVTFASGHAPVGAVTIDAAYLPLTTWSYVKSASISTGRPAYDATRLNDGFERKVVGAQGFSASVELTEPLYTDIDGRTPGDILDDGEPVLLDLTYDTGTTGLRAWVVAAEGQAELKADGIATGKIEFHGYPVRAEDGSVILYGRS